MIANTFFTFVFLLIVDRISITVGMVPMNTVAVDLLSSSPFMRNVYGIRRCHFINDWTNCSDFIKTSMTYELEYLRKTQEERSDMAISENDPRDRFYPLSDSSSITSPHVYSYVCISTANSSNIAEFSEVLKDSRLSSTVVMSKKSIQQSCYLLHSRLSHFKEQLVNCSKRGNNNLISAITEYGIIPSALKYNRFVFDLFDPTDVISIEASNPSIVLGHGDKTCLNEMKKFHESDIDEGTSSFELLVDFGLGISSFEPEPDESIDEYNMKNARDIHNGKTSASTIRSRDEVYSLNEYINLHKNDHRIIYNMANRITFPRQSNFLSDAYFDLNNNNHLCDFSMLTIEENANSAIIRGLHTISSIPAYGIRKFKSRSCYLKLLAILGSKDNIINIAIRPRMVPLNANSKSIMQRSVQQSSYTSSSFPYTNVGLNGTGQVIGIGDTGLDDSHCMFKNTDGSIIKRTSVSNCASNTYSTKRKVIQYVAYADSTDVQGGHGTHVSGTAVGYDISGTSNQKLYSGHASGARIAFFDMGNSNDGYITYPSPLSQNAFRCAKSAGANLYSASWGSGWNQYSSDSSDIDSYLFNNDNFLFIVAAGNDGSSGYFSIGDPAVSKNALTVGATVSSPLSNSAITDIAYFSSLGPSYDLRFKPDVVAPGFPITSAYASGSDCHSTGQMSGTSMATPAVAGSAAQIRQYFSDKKFWYTYCNKTYALCKNPPKTIRGVTVKAAVIHAGNKMSRYFVPSSAPTEVSTTSLASNPPDYFQGFGIVLLTNLLPISTGLFDLFFDEIAIKQKTSRTYLVHVLNKNYPLKVTLVWMDPPNSVVSISQLVHDLDLTVTSPSGSEFHGNGNNGNFKDEINNVEQVYISKANLEIGIYEVKIFANSFPKEASQKASIIITSPGYVGSNIITAPSTNNDTNTLKCPSNNMEVWIDKWDHSSNSWRTNSNYYELKNSATSLVVHTGYMTNVNTQVGHVYMREGLCVPFGDYSIKLKSAYGTDTPSDMGLTIQSCNVFLNYAYNKEAVIKIDQSGCNICSQNVLSLSLYGSFFGVPYGWHTGTEFTIVDLNSKKSIGATLVNGIIQVQNYCIADGAYSIGFSSLQYDDQPVNDDYSKQFGVEEYGVYALVGPSVDFTINAVKCWQNSGQIQCELNYDRVYFTINAGAVTTTNQTSGNNDDSTGGSSSSTNENQINSLVLHIIIVLGIVLLFGGFIYSYKFIKTWLCGNQSVNDQPPQQVNIQTLNNNPNIYSGNGAYAHAPINEDYMTPNNPGGVYIVHGKPLDAVPIYEIEMPQPSALVVDQQLRELEYYSQRRRQYQTISPS